MTGLDPTAASAHFVRGTEHVAAGEFDAAEPAFRAAIAADPSHSGALNNLGNLLRDRGEPDAAVECYQRAIAAHPDLWGIHNNLAITLLMLHRPAEAIAPLRRAIDLWPGFADAWNNLGGTLLALDRPCEALTAFRRAVTLDAEQITARFGEAIALLALGRYREGWLAYESRWDDPRFTADTPPFAEPRWRGEPVADRTVLLHAEQGLGDTIQFARYAPLVRSRGAHVLLRVDAALLPLLSPLADDVVAPDDPLPPFDLHCPLLSLPHVFDTELDSVPAVIPYLAAAADRVARWSERAGTSSRPRIGIAFSGSPDHADDAIRSIPAARFLAAFPPGCGDLHVVQTAIRPRDAATLATRADVHIHVEALTDFAETAALLAHMDLVVTVDTAVAHLAGALGKPVWILLQYAADFRWLRGRTDSPWYPTARLFRQSKLDDWDSVLAAVARALA